MASETQNKPRLAELSYGLTKLRLELYERLPRSLTQLRHGSTDFLKTAFPKSGTNWTQFLVVNALVWAGGRSDEIHFRNASDWISTTVPREPPVNGFQKLLSNTDPHDEQPYLDAETRVLYQIRHPGDVMESFYHYRRGRWNEDVGTFSEFIRSDRYGVQSWVDHVESWQGNWDVLVRFEDLKTDPATCLRDICSLFDHEFDEETIEYAVEQSSFENMAALEEEYGKKRKPGANPNYTFMREGSSDRGEEYFNEDDYRYLDDMAGDLMEVFGYEVLV
jgi:hypothetical protein